MKKNRIILIIWIIMVIAIVFLLFIVFKNKEKTSSTVSEQTPTQTAEDISQNKEDNIIDNDTNNTQQSSVIESNIENINKTSDIKLTNADIISEYNKDELIKELCLNYLPDTEEIILRKMEGNILYATLIGRNGISQEVAITYQSHYKTFSIIQSVEDYEDSTDNGGGNGSCLVSEMERVLNYPVNEKALQSNGDVLDDAFWVNRLSKSLKTQDVYIEDVENIEVYYNNISHIAVFKCNLPNDEYCLVSTSYTDGDTCPTYKTIDNYNLDDVKQNADSIGKINNPEKYLVSNNNIEINKILKGE